jgi:hypothetical protein
MSHVRIEASLAPPLMALAVHTVDTVPVRHITPDTEASQLVPNRFYAFRGLPRGRRFTRGPEALSRASAPRP